MGDVRLGSAHRDLRRALYMAKPRTAQTVAPTLTRSQNAELFRSAWVISLKKRAIRNEEEKG